MSASQSFEEWVSRELEIGPEELERTHLTAAFEMLVSRFEIARRLGAKDPLATGATKQAGGNSRRCTKRMLERLGYTASQRRAVQRLLVGTTGGWPGLLRLYAADQPLSSTDRQYARRQLNAFTVPRHDRPAVDVPAD
jgi:hypothetical protein